jgi:hypothetical protein
VKHAILPLSRRDRRCETSLCTKLEEGREEKKKEEGKRRKEERGAGRRKGKGKGGGGGGGRAGGRGRGEGGQVGGRSLRRRGEAGRATAAERRCGEVAFGRARHVVAGDEQGSLSLSLSFCLPLFLNLFPLSSSLFILSLPLFLSPFPSISFPKWGAEGSGEWKSRKFFTRRPGHCDARRPWPMGFGYCECPGTTRTRRANRGRWKGSNKLFPNCAED